MSDARAQILARIRRSLKADEGNAARRQTVAARLKARARGPIPARSKLKRDAVIALFVEQAEAVEASVTRLESMESVPQAVADYLKGQNLPAELRLAPHPELEALPWAEQTLLTVASGKAEPLDSTSVTAAVAGIAETGTLMLAAGPEAPTTLNFLPENHIVVLKSSQIVGPYEEAWDRLRKTQKKRSLPRAVNLVTGPSRTADIEQTIQMGAHGPRRLHIVLVDDETTS